MILRRILLWVWTGSASHTVGRELFEPRWEEVLRFYLLEFGGRLEAGWR